MFEQIILEQNKQWNKEEINTGIKREIISNIEKHIASKSIIVVTGIRRCGKSTLLKQIIKELLKEIETNEILFLNLEHPYFDEHRSQVKFLEKAFEEYIAMREPKNKIFVIFDEVQFFKNWQVFVKSKYDQNIKFLITGSNSWLLSSEYATLLSGRTISFEIFPFSFREFLSAKNVELNSSMDYLKNEKIIKKHFKEYFEWGGFPEVILTKENENKKELLKNYYSSILLQDIVPRFKLKNPVEAQELAHYLFSNAGKNISYSQLSKTISISDKTIKEYIHLFRQSYLLFELNTYSPSIKKQMRYSKKIYAGDIGFSNAIGFRNSEDYGRILENMVFIELLRRKKEIYTHYINKECDFIIRENKKIISAIQVCWNISSDNRKREIEGLMNALKNYKLKKGLILTNNQEETIKEKNCEIKIIPVWKWLLEDN